MTDNTKQTIGLAEAIEALRGELTEAMEKGNSQSMRFVVEPIEIQLNAAVTRNQDGKTGWSILPTGADSRSKMTQKINIRLIPMWETEDGTYSTSFAIADQSVRQQHFGPKHDK